MRKITIFAKLLKTKRRTLHLWQRPRPNWQKFKPLYRPINMFRWNKFFQRETKVKLDVVNMFFVAMYLLVESYMMVKGEKVSFIAEEINTLYGLSNNLDEYLGQGIIAKPIESDIKRVIKTITWLSTNWEETPTRKF